MNKIWLILLAVFSVFTAQAEEFLPVDEAYRVSYYSQDNQVNFDVQIEPEHYLYQYAFSVLGEGVSNVVMSDNHKTKSDPYLEEDVEVYYDMATVTANVETMPSLITFTYQGCAEAGLCYPPQKLKLCLESDGNLTDNLTACPVASSATSSSVDTGVQKTVKPFELSSYLFYVVAAFFGAMTLNLMPCVFPVLSFKAMSFASAAGMDKKHNRNHAWVYTLGVVLSFVAIGAVFKIVDMVFGISQGWGTQLQLPVFDAIMAYLFFFMGLALYGYLTFGTSFMGVGQNLTEGGGKKASFFTGALAVLVATPCTGPLMGAPLFFASTQPLPIALSVYAALGFGMAFPMLLLAYITKLADMLPRPGAWMETFKQAMAWPMFITAIWFLSLVGGLVDHKSMAMLAVGMVAIAFAFWPPLSGASKTSVGKVIKLVLKYGSLVWAAFLVYDLTVEKETNWEAWDKGTLAQYVDSADQPVFVDVTADWCITCKVNEKVAMSSDAFFEAATKANVKLVKADWTNQNDAILQYLESFDRVSVPLYVWYVPGQEPKVLGQTMQPKTMINLFDNVEAADMIEF